MIPPGADTAAQTGPPPVELTDRELELSRRSASWARFIAIVGIVLTGAIALGCLTVIIMGRRTAGSGTPLRSFRSASPSPASASPPC